MLRSLPLLVASCTLVRATTYNLLRDISGQNFFSHFQYFGSWDYATNSMTPDFLNSGDVFFANATYADSNGLTVINSAGNAVIRVDDTTVVPFNDKRISVSMNTTEMYGLGNVIVLDAVHVPFGCSVWPAFWTAALDWPTGGEVDIVEAVNLETTNQYALHTAGACTLVTTPGGMTGVAGVTDCQSSGTSDDGCTVMDPATTSFGAGFNSAGGGMWITELAEEAISIWFFSRPSIPGNFQTSANATSIDTSTLGTPVATWPSSGCNLAQSIAPQSIVIDITLCGDFARAVFNETCPPTRLNACYLDWVIGPPANYTNAYWEIASIRVFNNGSLNSVAGSEVAGGSSSTGGSSSGSTGGNGNGPNVGAAPTQYSISVALYLSVFAIATLLF